MQVPEIPANETQRLLALRERALLDTQPEERFDRLTRLARQLFATPIALVSLVDTERQWFKSRQGLEACETGRDISFCGHAILNTDIFEISDARLDPRFADNPLVAGPPHIRFYAGAPLSTPEGFRIGTLGIISDQPRALTHAERRALRDLADCVEVEINQVELKKQSQALRQFRSTLDRTLDCVFMFDANELIFFYVNEGAMRQVGYSREEMMSMHPYDIKPDITQTQFKSRIAPLLDGTKDALTFETVHQHKNGLRIPVEIFLQYMAPPGDVPHFVAIVRDITERKRVDRLKTEFISIVSHELRTPLTAIRGSLGLISGGVLGQLPEQVKSMLDIASNNTERLLMLINDILDIQKIEAGKMTFRYENVALMPLLEQAVVDLTTYADQHGVHYELTHRIDDAHVFVDRSRMMQVLANLLSNAAKFSPRDSRVEIAVARQEDGRVRISVSDFGPGISEGFKMRIFQPFTQSDASDTRSKGGTGLPGPLSNDTAAK